MESLGNLATEMRHAMIRLAVQKITNAPDTADLIELKLPDPIENAQEFAVAYGGVLANSIGTFLKRGEAPDLHTCGLLLVGMETLETLGSETLGKEITRQMEIALRYAEDVDLHCAALGVQEEDGS